MTFSIPHYQLHSWSWPDSSRSRCWKDAVTFLTFQCMYSILVPRSRYKHRSTDDLWWRCLTVVQLDILRHLHVSYYGRSPIAALGQIWVLYWRILHEKSTKCDSLASAIIRLTTYIWCVKPCIILQYCCSYYIPSVLWSCWLGGKKGIRPVKQEAQLSPRDRAMHRVNWNLANCHATVQKLLIRQVLTKSMVWSWRFSRRQCVIDNVHSTMTRRSRFHCLRCVINKSTTDDLWISPVYRRPAVAKFSKSTM